MELHKGLYFWRIDKNSARRLVCSAKEKKKTQLKIDLGERIYYGVSHLPIHLPIKTKFISSGILIVSATSGDITDIF